MIFAVIAVVLPQGTPSSDQIAVAAENQALLVDVEAGADHMEPPALADALMRGERDLLVIDLRPEDEYRAFHLAGAVNVQLPELIDYLTNRGPHGRIVLYSNGMTHPSQGRDALSRLGYRNVYMLTDGLQGFLDQCLKPVSLRDAPLSASAAQRVRQWRTFFIGEEPMADAAAGGQVAAAHLAAGQQAAQRESEPVISENDAPRLISTRWLAEHLHDSDLRIIDCRTHADYTKGHIPGSLYLNLESVRGNVGGIPSVLLPKEVLAQHMSLLGIHPTDMVVFDPGESVRDATLISMALERLGHQRWGILHGGFPKWTAEQHPIDKTLPRVAASNYPVPAHGDDFTVDAAGIAKRLHDAATVILDTRPKEYYTGDKSSEMRPGHIPGALSHVFKEDLDQLGNLKPVPELAAAYQKLIPSLETPVVVYCRTGHQAQPGLLCSQGSAWIQEGHVV